MHATVLEQDVCNPISNNRIIPITSKGGLIMLKRMKKIKKENPYYARFNDILKIFKKYNAVISLGPTYRPGSICDNSMAIGDAYWIEMQRMSVLVKKAVAYEVPIIVEGIGHASLDNIPQYICKSKELCLGVPYRVLTVSTDIALGYDNISSAIASAVSVLNGANIVTAVTSAEHIALPTKEQVEEAVISAKIAAHSADLCKNNSIDRDMQISLSKTRIKNCQGSIDMSIYPQGAKKALLANKSHAQGCSMCGIFCALTKDGINDT